MKRLAATVAALSFFFPSNNLHAKLASSSLADLLNDSFLVVRARAEELGSNNDGKGGKAHLRVEKVYKGDYASPMVTVLWTHEIHDQPISKIGQSYLLFLRPNKDALYTGTQYGRSFWPLEVEDGSARALTRYTYPTNLIQSDFPGTLKEAKVGGVKTWVFFVDEVLSHLPDETQQPGWVLKNMDVFSFRLPPKFRKRRSINKNSLVGRYTSTTIDFTFEYGRFSDSFGKWPATTDYEYVVIDGRRAQIGTVKADMGRKHPYATQIYFESTSTGIPNYQLSMFASCATEKDIKTAHKIFKSIRF